MASLKPALLLLFLVFLDSAEGQSCKCKKTKLTILSGAFEGVSDQPPLVKIMALEPNSMDPLDTEAVRSFKPEWNQDLLLENGSNALLFVKINDEKPRFICFLKKMSIRNGFCEKTYQGARYYVEYAISC